jgi:hypothetical protein
MFSSRFHSLKLGGWKMEKYLPFLQILVSLMMITLATFIGELVKAHEEQRRVPGWQFWRYGLANAQWAFASFYLVVIWANKSVFLRLLAFGFFLACAVAFGFSTGLASRIANIGHLHCHTTPDERWNTKIALASLLIVYSFAAFLVWYS